MTFEKIIEDFQVEDIILCPEGILYFKEKHWHGPEPSNLTNDKAQLWELARKIAESASLSLGLTQPSVDALLSLSRQQNFRAHVVIPPMVLSGPTITLRRLPVSQRFPLSSFSDNSTIIKTLEESLKNSESFLIAGATGSGKTTLVNSLIENLPINSRIIILEDSPEIPIPNSLSSKLLARNNRFGFRQGASWNLSDLVFESLRMRPERLILGECRGPEALALAHALQTGHKGLITTIHAGNKDEAQNRFIELASQQSEFSIDQLSQCWDNIIVIENHKQGSRKIKEYWKRSQGMLL
jgi:pilus assembly protein CpaF